MRQYLNESDTIGGIRQARRHPTGKNYLWILVEGTTDQKLYTKLIDGKNTKIEIAHGGVEKLRTALIILTEETNQVLGIRDADFLHLDRKAETINNLFVTDAHDSEMMMLSCDKVCEALVVEYLPSKRNNFSEFRSKILLSLSFLGGIRWINNTENLELNFKGGLVKFYDVTSLELNQSDCIKEIEKCSPNKKRSIQLTEVEAKISNISDHYNLCCGHDFENAFALHVSKATKTSINNKDVGTSLRLAYRKEDFSLTKLYESLKNWEQQTGYLLFKA